MLRSHTKSDRTGDAEAETHAQGKTMESRLAQINRMAPDLGAAIAAAFSGPLAPVLLLGMAVQQVKSCLSDYNEELDSEAGAGYQPHIEAVKRLQSAWDNASGSYGEYLAKPARAGKNSDPTKTQIDRARDGLAGKEQIHAAPGKFGEGKFDPDRDHLMAAREALDPLSPAGKALQKEVEDAAAVAQDAKWEPDSSGNSSTGFLDNRIGEAIEIAAARARRTGSRGEQEPRVRSPEQPEGNDAQRVKAKTAASPAAADSGVAAGLVQDWPFEGAHEGARGVIDFLNTQGGQLNESLGRLAAETGRTQLQTVAIIESILAGHSTMQQRMAQLEAQLAATNHTHHSG